MAQEELELEQYLKNAESLLQQGQLGLARQEFLRILERSETNETALAKLKEIQEKEKLQPPTRETAPQRVVTKMADALAAAKPFKELVASGTGFRRFRIFVGLLVSRSPERFCGFKNSAFV